MLWDHRWYPTRQPPTLRTGYSLPAISWCRDLLTTTCNTRNSEGTRLALTIGGRKTQTLQRDQNMFIIMLLIDAYDISVDGDRDCLPNRMVINAVKKGQGEECVNFLSKELCYGVVNAEEKGSGCFHMYLTQRRIIVCCGGKRI